MRVEYNYNETIKGVDFIETVVDYHKEIHSVKLGTKNIKVEGLTPLFERLEREKNKRAVEENLYRIFKKYQ